MSNEFTTIAEGFRNFKRAAISDLTPPKISKALEGSFFAGAQTMLTLMAEAMDITPAIANEKMLTLFSECQSFFVLARAAQETKILEKGAKAQEKSK